VANLDVMKKHPAEVDPAFLGPAAFGIVAAADYSGRAHGVSHSAEFALLERIPVGLIQFGVIAGHSPRRWGVNALMTRQSMFLRKGWTRGSSPRVT
jgi:hypothetical protein